ncbi:MAG TPA: AMP-binding protein [Solirubrobacteraceae bacterium]|nr:AMP-binding protein [Solirubrobacteraceae bacterium]
MFFLAAGAERRVALPALREQAFVFARGLRGMGFQKGERVVVILPDEEQFVQAFLGAVCCGVVPVAVFPPFMLNRLDSYIRHLELVASVSEAAAIVTVPELRVLIEETDLALPLLTLDEVEGSAIDVALQPPDEKDIAFLQFTSGSTAAPRGVVVTHRSLLANARAISHHLALDPAIDRGVSWLPMYHDMGLGLVVLTLLAQGSTWYISPLDFVRRPQIWCETIDAVRGTIGFAPNFAYELLARRAQAEEVLGWDLSCWRVAGCGAEPISGETLRAFARRLAPAGFDSAAFFPSYGMAEATLAVSFPRLGRGLRTLSISRKRLAENGLAVSAVGDEPAHEIVACGCAMAGHELAIVDADGRLQRDRSEGEILFRGPSVASGYYNNEAATAEAFRDGWLHTQDLGFMDNGELFLTGRKKDMIIIRGRNYYPHDIEWAAQDVSGVRRGNAVAFGYRDESGVERVVVVVEARDVDSVEEISDSVAARVRAHLGIVVADAVVIEKDTLPKTSSGKVRRAETRMRYLARELPVLASSRGTVGAGRGIAG